jgi:hypothetical protein
MIFHRPSPDALWSFWIPPERERFPIARHEIKFQILIGKSSQYCRELLAIRLRADGAKRERRA